MPTTVDEPRSRRDRPAKPPLSRRWIIDETLRIMREEGLERATMRRVARALDTGPASLYAYVSSTAELHAAVVDELVGPIEAPADEHWRPRLVALLTRYRDVLAAHPGLARSALVLRPSGPHLLALFDELIGLLLEGGAGAVSASWGADLLLQTATATAAEHGRSPNDLDAGRDLAAQQRATEAAVRRSDPSVTPHLAAHADAVVGGTPDQRWTWALDALVNGVLATSPPA